MRKIAVANRKGRVGKTVSALHLAAGADDLRALRDYFASIDVPNRRESVRSCSTT
jgi:MinD-like ATPase involved in chromosome partitioning or flagellar assembly